MAQGNLGQPLPYTRRDWYIAELRLRGACNWSKHAKRVIENEVNIAWLDQEWGGSGWIPSELRANFGSYRLKEPCGETVELLCMITTAAKARDINPADLWLPDGALRVAVERDTEEKALRYDANKWHAKPKAHLSVKVARAALALLAHGTVRASPPRHPPERAPTAYYDTPDDGAVALEAVNALAHDDNRWSPDDCPPHSPGPSTRTPMAPQSKEMVPPEGCARKRAHNAMDDTSDIESTLGALTSDDFDQIRAKTEVRLQKAESAQMKAALDLAELQGREQSRRVIQRASVRHAEVQREKINQRLGIGRRKDSDPMDQLLEATALSQMHLVQDHRDAIFSINRSLPALIATTKTRKEEAGKAVRAAKGRLTALDHMWAGKLAAEKKHVAAVERERAAFVMRQANNNYEKTSEGLDNAISMASQEDWAAIIRDVRAEKAKAS